LGTGAHTSIGAGIHANIGARVMLILPDLLKNSSGIRKIIKIKKGTK